MKTRCSRIHFFVIEGNPEISFLLRSFSWHGGAFHVAVGQGVLPRYFTAAVWPCDSKQTHSVCDNYDLKEGIMWQLLKLSRQAAPPAGSQWNQIFYICEKVGLILDMRSDVKDVVGQPFLHYRSCVFFALNWWSGAYKILLNTVHQSVLQYLAAFHWLPVRFRLKFNTNLIYLNLVLN